MMKEVTLTAANFEDEVLKAQGPVLVDFWATWCGPCRMLAPIVKEIAEEGQIKVGKVNVDEEQALAVRFKVTAIPTIVALRDGQQIGMSVGYQEKEKLLAMFA